MNDFSTSALSLLPPVAAIVMAVITRRVLLSIGCGIVLGACMLNGLKPIHLFDYLKQIIYGHFYQQGQVEFGNLNIVFFLLLMGMMMQLMLSLGASKSFALWVYKRVKSRRRAQWVINLLAVFFFIDDYLHSLLAGNISRPIADQYKISRAKLAYLLDSTAATICVVTPVSSWGGYILGIIAAILATHQVQNISAISLFLQMSPMMFYTWFALLTVALVTQFNINIGPMATHEFKAQQGLDVQEKSLDEFGSVHLFWVIGPIVVTSVCAMGMMFWTGWAELNQAGLPVSVFKALENADVGVSIVLGAVCGLVLLSCACVRRLSWQRFLSESWVGMRLMVPAICILFFAWTIASVVNDMGTGEFLATLTKQHIPSAWLPFLLFILSGMIALATGTSFATFGVMLPLAADIAMATDIHLLLPVMAAVLSGAVFGDHCSPISDTTVMSSSGAGCCHIDHVITQAPYAVCTAVVSSISFIVLGWTQSVSLSFMSGLGCLLILGVLLRKQTKCAQAASVIH